MLVKLKYAHIVAFDLTSTMILILRQYLTYRREKTNSIIDHDNNDIQFLRLFIFQTPFAE